MLFLALENEGKALENLIMMFFVYASSGRPQSEVDDEDVRTDWDQHLELIGVTFKEHWQFNSS